MQIEKVLNVGSGKLDKLDNYNLTVFLDSSYKDGLVSSIQEIEEDYALNKLSVHYCCLDVFDFLEKFKFKFDRIYAQRFLEHLDYCSGEVSQFLFLLSQCTKKGGTFTFIVPDSSVLSEKLLSFEITDTDHSTSVQLITLFNTELVSTKASPHVSVWTPKLAREYIEYEKLWKITNISMNYEIDNRPIYMMIEGKRI